MNLEAVLNYRRSVRNYQTDNNLDTEKVKHCLEMATLAPSSSNMQLCICLSVAKRCRQCQSVGCFRYASRFIPQSRQKSVRV